MGWTNRQAVALFRTSCEVLDVPAFLSHPTAAHLAPFYLAIARSAVSVRVSHICSVVHWRTISGSFAHGRISGGGKILRAQSTTGLVGDSPGGMASERCHSHRILSAPSAEQEHLRPLAQCAESAGICA